MKKRRGKRPVKPNITEALKDRVIDLKGAQFSSMNIPIIYRRTFDWGGDSVLFRPINKRSFVVQRPLSSMNAILPPLGMPRHASRPPMSSTACRSAPYLSSRPVSGMTRNVWSARVAACVSISSRTVYTVAPPFV